SGSNPLEWIFGLASLGLLANVCETIASTVSEQNPIMASVVCVLEYSSFLPKWKSRYSSGSGFIVLIMQKIDIQILLTDSRRPWLSCRCASNTASQYLRFDA